MRDDQIFGRVVAVEIDLGGERRVHGWGCVDGRRKGRARVLDVETGDSLNFRRPGVQDGVLRKLRRGQYRLESEIDLHGLTLREAKAELRVFLARAIARQLRCVRIVHGKGLGSGPRGPVLKHAVNGILQRTDLVVAFCSARPVDGGTGAIYVLLHG